MFVCVSQAPCLYNITADPCEYHNLADQYPDMVRQLLERMEIWNKYVVMFFFTY